MVSMGTIPYRIPVKFQSAFKKTNLTIHPNTQTLPKNKRIVSKVYEYLQECESLDEFKSLNKKPLFSQL
ncbi:hypothetical protein BpHYR1_007725 [Brachionus plicatilis]|uniref:Uncharacterized protein n=1 Tax=Brachionus plicatilis TaxID=10195 RepID=A0A3M7RGY3_BRAPC|nr:hypothetical protein BpHYR1_007725 [Brachionus plicatilis]